MSLVVHICSSWKMIMSSFITITHIFQIVMLCHATYKYQLSGCCEVRGLRVDCAASLDCDRKAHLALSMESPCSPAKCTSLN